MVPVDRILAPDGVALDFAGQCEERLVDLDFDLICSKLALPSWAEPPDAAHPVVDLRRELESERQRHRDALTQLRQRLLELTKNAAAHHHLPLPAVRYQEQVRDRLFPDLKLRPVQNPAVSGEHNRIGRY